MSRVLDLFVYLDENLVRSFNSILLDGYIDIYKITKVKDKTLTGQVRLLNRESDGEDFKFSKEENDGYKKKINNNHDHCEGVNENNAAIEDKEYSRKSEEITRINTLFLVHNEMVNALNNFGGLRYISENHIINDNINEGELVEIHGEICDSLLVPYIDTFINIITAYGDDYLNNFINEKNRKCLLNFTIILRLLKYIKEDLISNGTQDIIFMAKNTPILLLVNEKNFLGEKAHMYDLMHCKCKVLGKVMKVNSNDDTISLMRKSCKEDYYEKVLNSIEPYFHILEEEGVILPKRCDFNIRGKSINILPISICI